MQSLVHNSSKATGLGIKPRGPGADAPNTLEFERGEGIQGVQTGVRVDKPSARHGMTM